MAAVVVGLGSPPRTQDLVSRPSQRLAMEAANTAVRNEIGEQHCVEESLVGALAFEWTHRVKCISEQNHPLVLEQGEVRLPVIDWQSHYVLGRSLSQEGGDRVVPGAQPALQFEPEQFWGSSVVQGLVLAGRTAVLPHRAEAGLAEGHAEQSVLAPCGLEHLLLSQGVSRIAQAKSDLHSQVVERVLPNHAQSPYLAADSIAADYQAGIERVVVRKLQHDIFWLEAYLSQSHPPLHIDSHLSRLLKKDAPQGLSGQVQTQPLFMIPQTPVISKLVPKGSTVEPPELALRIQNQVRPVERASSSSLFEHHQSFQCLFGLQNGEAVALLPAVETGILLKHDSSDSAHPESSGQGKS